MFVSDSTPLNSGHANVLQSERLDFGQCRPSAIENVSEEFLELLRESGLFKKIAAGASQTIIPLLTAQGIGGSKRIDGPALARLIEAHWSSVDDKTYDRAFCLSLISNWWVSYAQQLTQHISDSLRSKGLKIAQAMVPRRGDFYWEDVLFAWFCRPNDEALPEVLKSPFKEVLRGANGPVGRIRLPEKCQEFWVTWYALHAIAAELERLRYDANRRRQALFERLQRVSQSLPSSTKKGQRRGKVTIKHQVPVSDDEGLCWRELADFTSELSTLIDEAGESFRCQIQGMQRLLERLDVDVGWPQRESEGGDVIQWGWAELDLFMGELEERRGQLGAAIESYVAAGLAPDRAIQILELIDRFEPAIPDRDLVDLQEETVQLEKLLEVSPLKEALSGVPILHALATICIDLEELNHRHPWQQLKKSLTYYFVEGLETKRHGWNGLGASDQEATASHEGPEPKPDRKQEEESPTILEETTAIAERDSDDRVEPEAIDRTSEERSHEPDRGSEAVAEAVAIADDCGEGEGEDSAMIETAQAAPVVNDQGDIGDGVIASDEATKGAVAPAAPAVVQEQQEEASSVEISPKSTASPPAVTPGQEHSEIIDEVESLSDEELTSRIENVVLVGDEESTIPVYGLLAEQQRRWLLRGENLRAFAIAQFNDQAQHSTEDSFQRRMAMIPSWLCWMAIYIGDENAVVMEPELGQLAGSFYGLTYQQSSVSKFALTWLCVGLLGDTVDFALEILKNSPRGLFQGSELQESEFYSFLVDRLIQPAQRGHQPKMETKKSIEALQREYDGYLERAKEAIDSGRANYNKSMVKRFWRTLVSPEGPAQQLSDQVERGDIPKSWPEPEELAQSVENWDKVIAEYRRNIQNRLETFLKQLRRAARVRLAITNREQRKENVLSKDSIKTAVEDGNQVLRRLQQERSPSAYPTKLLLNRLQEVEHYDGT